MFYLDLFSALSRHRVEYLLIGGLAVSLHGVERATMDVDITVATSPENLAALLDTANELGLSPVLPVPLTSLTDIELLRRWHTERNLESFALRAPELAGVTVDILPFPPLDYGGMRGRAVMLEVGGVSIPVVSIPDLIALKRAAGRPIDLSDIVHLERIASL